MSLNVSHMKEKLLYIHFVKNQMKNLERHEVGHI